MFGTTTNGVDGTTDKEFRVAYTVTPIPVSPTDARIAYKTVTVTVDWVGPPYPHKSVTLSTVVYRQSAGPRIIDTSLDSTKLAANKIDIAMTPIRVTYVVDEADLPDDGAEDLRRRRRTSRPSAGARRISASPGRDRTRFPTTRPVSLVTIRRAPSAGPAMSSYACTGASPGGLAAARATATTRSRPARFSTHRVRGRGLHPHRQHEGGDGAASGGDQPSRHGHRDCRQ